MNIIEQIKLILYGIDRTETDSPEGWWETSDGAQFGTRKLEEIIQAIEQNERE